MDFGGESLFSLLKGKHSSEKVDPRPSINAISVLKQLVEAIAYLHSSNLVHADLKLENVIYLQGHVKLCDFGFTHYAKKDTSQNTSDSYNGCQSQ